MANNLLIVEDEETLRGSLTRVLQREGYSVDGVPSAEAAIQALAENVYDLMITDIILPGMSGMELLRKAKEFAPDLTTIVMTAYASTETAVEALRSGAYDYIMKPIIHEEIKKIVSNALTQKALVAENAVLRRQIDRKFNFDRVIGESVAIKSVLGEIAKIADTRSNVLITGETGTGKELLARAVHYGSRRRNNPFIPINCSAIPEHLLESELFGHARGAFTSAFTSKKGLFEEADGGSIFLDEIGELHPNMQAKLLRVLEDQEIRPVGSTQSRKVDVRIISATNRDIEQAVEVGDFREDLYYRINVITVTLPPLRERNGDVVTLAEFFLQRFGAEVGRGVKTLSDEARRALSAYNWPGNVRELQNVIERAVLISDSDTIMPEHLPRWTSRKDPFMGAQVRKQLSIEDYTRAFIMEYQDSFSEQQIADMLGITRKTLWEKRKKWDLRR
ncbi:MAG: sigma-54-dependent Fis family transcriptional regulator [Nitrospirae bacterium]|nr:sigma-54-dependent Fis family transcriptional regulator [Nitrospirota bacterium]